MQIIFSICLAFVWTDILYIHRRIGYYSKKDGRKKALLNFKPFNCTVCMSGWITLGYYGLHWSSLQYMALAMVAMILLRGIINKL